MTLTALGLLRIEFPGSSFVPPISLPNSSILYARYFDIWLFPYEALEMLRRLANTARLLFFFLLFYAHVGFGFLVLVLLPSRVCYPCDQSR